MKQTSVKDAEQANKARPTPAETVSSPLQGPLPLLLHRATLAPDSINAADASQLQRAIGNRAVGRLAASQGSTLPKNGNTHRPFLQRILQRNNGVVTRALHTTRATIQPKLTLGPVGDQYEQEADQVAAQVVRRVFAQRGEGQEAVMAKPVQGVRRVVGKALMAKSAIPRQRQSNGPDEEVVQAQTHDTTGGDLLSTQLERAIDSARNGGQPLTDDLRQPMESAFDADFGAVKLHTDAQSDTLNKSIQARAFTTGRDIFFRQGEYNPGSNDGQELLAHELTHVVQQTNPPVSQRVQRVGDPPTAQERKYALTTMFRLNTVREVHQTPEGRAQALSNFFFADARPKDSVESLEMVAGLLSGPSISEFFPTDRLTQEIENLFGQEADSPRAYYLISMLSAGNQTPVGEPSLTAQLLMSTGLVLRASVSADRKEIVNLIEVAPWEQLNEVIESGYRDAILSRIERAFGVKTATYLSRKLDVADATERAQSQIPGEQLRVSDVVPELVALLELIVSEARGVRKSRQLTSEASITRLQSWIEQLQTRFPRGWQTILRAIPESPQVNAFFQGHEISDRHKNYILSLFGRGDAQQWETATPAGNLAAYLEKKAGKSEHWYRNKGWHWTTLLQKIEAMDMDDRLEYLALIYGVSPDDLEQGVGREDAINYLKIHLSERGVPLDKLELIARAFRFGAADHSTEARGTYNRLKKKVAQKTSKRSTILKLVYKLRPDEYLQVRQDNTLIELIKGKLEVHSNEWRSVETLLNLGPFAEDMPDRLKAQDQESPAREYTKNLVMMRPEYWSALLARELGKPARSWSRNEIMSLVARAYNTAAQVEALPDNTDNYPDTIPNTVLPVSTIDFMNDIVSGLDNDSAARLSSETVLRPAHLALEEGRPVSREERIAAARNRNLRQRLRAVRGYHLRPSAVVKAIQETQGRQLLTEWTNFQEFIDLKQAYDGAQVGVAKQRVKERLRLWVPELDADLLFQLRHALPKDAFINLHKDFLFRLADAIESDDLYREAMEEEGRHADSLEAERLRSIARLYREQAVDTGWQLEYFSAKASERREAKRTLVGRLRGVHDEIRDKGVGQEREGLDQEQLAGQLAEAGELLERRTEAFESLKDQAVEWTMFAISVLIGIAVSVATMGSAAPLIAAGLTAQAAQFILALSATLLATTLKELIKDQLVGALNNDREIVYNVVKSMALASATVGAGEISGLIGDTGFLDHLSEVEQAWADKFANVSPVEVFLRTVTDKVFEGLTAVEPKDKPFASWRDARNAGIAYVGDTVFDALLKGTFDMMATKASGAIPESSYAVDDEGEAWIPDLEKAGAGVLAVIAGENFATAQNYSVAEQDAILVKLIEDFGIETVKARIRQAFPYAWGENPSQEKEEKEEQVGGLQQELAEAHVHPRHLELRVDVLIEVRRAIRRDEERLNQEEQDLEDESTEEEVERQERQALAI